MHDFFLERPPWWVVGPGLGLIVVFLRATINQQLSVTGGFSAIVERSTGRTHGLRWQAWFVLGVVLGGTLYGLASGRLWLTDYGWLTRTFAGSEAWLAAPVLAGAGVLIGYGTKLAGGCTSGNGLAGCAAASPASLVSTATFFGTAIVGSFVLRWLGAA